MCRRLDISSFIFGKPWWSCALAFVCRRKVPWLMHSILGLPGVRAYPVMTNLQAVLTVQLPTVSWMLLSLELQSNLLES